MTSCRRYYSLSARKGKALLQKLQPDWYVDYHKRTLFFFIKTHPKLCELKLKQFIFLINLPLVHGRNALLFTPLSLPETRIEDIFFFPRWVYWYGWQIDAVCQLVAHFLSRKDFLKGWLSFLGAWKVGSKNEYSRERQW